MLFSKSSIKYLNKRSQFTVRVTAEKEETRFLCPLNGKLSTAYSNEIQ